MDEYKQQIELTKENIRKTEEMLKEIETREQERFEKKVFENTDNFWICG